MAASTLRPPLALPPLPGPPHSVDADALLAALRADAGSGLSAAEARSRRQRWGPNELRKTPPVPWWSLLVSQFKTLVMLLLIGAAALAFAFEEHIEGVAILILIGLNIVIGFVMDLRAVRSMEALRSLGGRQATVVRDGAPQAVSAEDLVPGDLVVIDAGDVVSADLRLLDGSRLLADESTFTGESLPVTKAVGTVAADAAVHERHNMLYKGTTVTQGSGHALVVATGTDTELGRIADLVAAAAVEPTPLELRLDRLGRRLIVVVLGIVLVVAALGVLRGKPLLLMAEIGIALAIAAIPEGLPVVATLALARGMLRMARRNALVRRLSAVETLGATTTICVDKTGTLTENRMTVTHVALADHDVTPARPAGPHEELLHRLLEVAALCNNAALGGNGTATGDPMEVALLARALEAGIDRPGLVHGEPEVHEEAFDPATKMMATFHESPGGLRVAVKGAPEAVLERCTRVATRRGDEALDAATLAAWRARNESMAAEGLRILALAERTARRADEPPYDGLTLLGLVGLVDPPRRDVPDAIAECRRAGIQVVMVTGDQAGTARRIAAAVGIEDRTDALVVQGRDLRPFEALGEDERAALRRTTIFARVSPQQKLAIIALHQSAGGVVAMTGDGVNDAPALRKADIGVAMGGRGTEVAREASDLVLRDDAFPTIVEAVRQGRTIFTNIRRFAFYLLSCNVGEVAIVATAAVLDTPLPLLPLQILFLNLVTDVFPALALGFGRGDASEMKRGPRNPKEPFLTGRHWWGITGYGVVFTASVMGVFLASIHFLAASPAEAVTVSFLALAFGQLGHIFNMRDPSTHPVRNDIVRSPYVWGALGLSAVLLLLALVVAPVARVLSLRPLEPALWGVVAVGSLLPLLVGQLLLWLRR